MKQGRTLEDLAREITRQAEAKRDYVANTKNMEGMTTYLERLPNKEFCAMWFKDLLLRHPDMDKNQYVTKFTMKHLSKVTH